jgi:hypothetical protein
LISDFYWSDCCGRFGMKLTLLIVTLTAFYSFGQVPAPPPDVKFPDIEVSKSDVYDFISEPEPSYPGGFEALKMHIQNYEHLGWEGEESSKRGYVSFVVEADVRLMDIQVVRGISPELDDLMLRMVEEMPRWIPACYRNNCYRNRVRLPITFVLEYE